MMLTLEKRKQMAREISEKLKELFPHAKCILNYKNPFELLVAVILSAQCTDKKVNEVTKNLFKKYPTLKSYVEAKPEEFEKDIYSTGFYKNKTKSVLAAACAVQNAYDGKVPRTMQELLTLPGVARKTANVVLGNAYQVVEGIAIDTHMRRMSHVLGLSVEEDPNKIEQDLMKLLPQPEWFDFTYRMIEYGRTYCHAKKHDHANCPLIPIVAKHN